MMIELELTEPDARELLTAVNDAALSWRLHAATSDGMEAGYAEDRARGLQAVATRICDELIPEDPRRVILREEIELGLV